MKFRLIKLDAYNNQYDGRMQMAIDEAIMIARSENKVPNTLRFYEFKPYTITYGITQNPNILKSFIEEKGYNYVRRLSAGSAVLQKNDFVYAVILDEDQLEKQFSKTKDLLPEIYKEINKGIIYALSELGINVSLKEKKSDKKDICYLNDNLYDVIVNGKKIVGSAQTRLNCVFLQHGSIIIEDNIQELLNYFDYSNNKKDDLIRIAKNKVTCVKDEIKYKPDFSVLEQLLISGFERSFSDLFDEKIIFEEGTLTDYELKIANDLYLTKYNTSKWNDKNG